jgi:hypothetical protein
MTLPGPHQSPLLPEAGFVVLLATTARRNHINTMSYCVDVLVICYKNQLLKNIS